MRTHPLRSVCAVQTLTPVRNTSSAPSKGHEIGRTKFELSVLQGNRTCRSKPPAHQRSFRGIAGAANVHEMMLGLTCKTWIAMPQTWIRGQMRDSLAVSRLVATPEGLCAAARSRHRGRSRPPRTHHGRTWGLGTSETTARQSAAVSGVATTFVRLGGTHQRAGAAPPMRLNALVARR